MTAPRLIAIANPTSGRGKALRLAPKLAKLARESGVEIHLELTRYAGHGFELARDAKLNGFDGIVACGGDGTLNEVINGMRDAPLPLMLVALGTGNVLAKEIGATSDPMIYLNSLREWRLIVRDLGRLQDGRLFACFVGAGFDAECTRQIKELRHSGTMKKRHYVPAIWRAIKSADFSNIRATVNGETPPPASYALTALTTTYGGPLSLTPQSVPDDGLFDVLTIHQPINGLSVLQILAYALVDRMPIYPHGKNLQTKRVTISAEEADGRKVPVQIDGDFSGYLPVTCEIVPGGLKMFKPE